MCRSRAIVDIRRLDAYFTADPVRSNPLRFTAEVQELAERVALTGRCGPCPIRVGSGAWCPTVNRRSTHF